MDPISASCCNLNSEELTSQINAQRKANETYYQILGSTRSLSTYEKRDFKNLTPQILAALIVCLFHISIGISLAFSAIAIPQLDANPEFEMTRSQASWIASIIALTTPAGSLVVGFLMDHYGRLPTLAMASVPGVGGCVVMALSHNVEMLILGRALVGFASAIGQSPAIVYLTEIARKDMRGSLISFASGLASLGMVLTFLMGWFMTWRQVAWCSNAFMVVPCLLVFFIPESPAWLVSKGRIEEARKSLAWIHRYQPQPENRTQTLAELQLALLQKEHELKTIETAMRAGGEASRKAREFLKPTGYKPMLILVGLFFFQQFSGIFIFLFYSINFFQEIGCELDPYLASIFIGLVRVSMSVVNTYIQRAFGRRALLEVSVAGMAVCVFLSGLSTHWIRVGAVHATWIPVVCLLFFVMTSMVGVIPVPFTMTAELFPLEIRGVSHSVSICIASFLMFVSLQSYPALCRLFGGVVGLQYFFAAVCLVGVAYAHVFVPETQGKTLSEIGEYFRHNVVFVGRRRKGEAVDGTAEVVTATIVKKQSNRAGDKDEVDKLINDV